jgi:hypothetical protein
MPSRTRLGRSPQHGLDVLGLRPEAVEAEDHVRAEVADPLGGPAQPRLARAEQRHGAAGEPLEELRDQVRPVHVQARIAAEQAEREAHAHAVPEHEVGGGDVTGEGLIPPGEVEAVGVDEGDDD